MKISVDIDGTLYAHKAFFRELFRLCGSAGHSIGILTGHSAECEQKDRAELAAMGFTVDFYLGRTAEYMSRNGMHFKRDMILAHGIDLHFDDLDYGLADTTRILAASGDNVIRRIIIVPHKGNSVRSE